MSFLTDLKSSLRAIKRRAENTIYFDKTVAICIDRYMSVEYDDTGSTGIIYVNSNHTNRIDCLGFPQGKQDVVRFPVGDRRGRVNVTFQFNDEGVLSAEGATGQSRTFDWNIQSDSGSQSTSSTFHHSAGGPGIVRLRVYGNVTYEVGNASSSRDPLTQIQNILRVLSSRFGNLNASNLYGTNTFIKSLKNILRTLKGASLESVSTYNLEPTYYNNIILSHRFTTLKTFYLYWMRESTSDHVYAERRETDYDLDDGYIWSSDTKGLISSAFLSDYEFSVVMEGYFGPHGRTENSCYFGVRFEDNTGVWMSYNDGLRDYKYEGIIAFTYSYWSDRVKVYLDGSQILNKRHYISSPKGKKAMFFIGGNPNNPFRNRADWRRTAHLNSPFKIYRVKIYNNDEILTF